MAEVMARPVGRDRTRPNLRPVLVYGTAATITSALTGLTLWLLAKGVADELPRRGAVLLGFAVTVVGAVAIVQEARGRFAPFPQRHAQVPRRWLHWRTASRTAAGYGGLLGVVILTRMHHVGAYSLGCALILAPSPVDAALAGSVYGAGRGVSLFGHWFNRGVAVDGSLLRNPVFVGRELLVVAATLAMLMAFLARLQVAG